MPANQSSLFEKIEIMPRGDLNSPLNERVRYTMQYAAEHSPFYRHWFRENNIKLADIRVHEDLFKLLVISGKMIQEHQPPVTKDFEFLSAQWSDVFSIRETSGTNGVPKSFFLTWDDWKRYAEKYTRSYVSQVLSSRDKIVVCASYGVNVGANTLTIAARRIAMGIIPIGICTFESRILKNYRPISIVGSVFKLHRLARRLKAGGINPSGTSISRFAAGGGCVKNA